MTHENSAQEVAEQRAEADPRAVLRVISGQEELTTLNRDPNVWATRKPLGRPRLWAMTSEPQE